MICAVQQKNGIREKSQTGYALTVEAPLSRGSLLRGVATPLRNVKLVVGRPATNPVNLKDR